MRKINLKAVYGDAEGPLGFPMTSQMAQAVEETLKRVPDEVRQSCQTEINGQQVQGYMRICKVPDAMDIDDDTRTDVSLVTSATLDRDREVVVPAGLSWKFFRKNPVVTFAHDYRSLNIGRALWVKRQKHATPSKDGWLAKTRYTPAPDTWMGPWFADAVWHMVKLGDLRGKSIGFIPTDVRQPRGDDIKARPELADARLIIAKAEVLEYAVAPVQANPDALVTSIGKCREAGYEFPVELLERMGLYLTAELPSIEAFLQESEPELAGLPQKAWRDKDIRQLVRRELRKTFSGINVPALVQDTLREMRGQM